VESERLESSKLRLSVFCKHVSNRLASASDYEVVGIDELIRELGSESFTDGRLA
jgi:hypothetical protein